MEHGQLRAAAKTPEASEEITRALDTGLEREHVEQAHRNLLFPAIDPTLIGESFLCLDAQCFESEILTSFPGNHAGDDRLIHNTTASLAMLLGE